MRVTKEQEQSNMTTVDACRYPGSHPGTRCRCHVQMGTDFYFLPSDDCLFKYEPHDEPFTIKDTKMPYVDEAARARVKLDSSAESAFPKNAGELNYLLTLSALRYLEQAPLNYQRINNVITALGATQRFFGTRQADGLHAYTDDMTPLAAEFAMIALMARLPDGDTIGTIACMGLEFYRRVAVPYETRKAHDNGDVYADFLDANDLGYSAGTIFAPRGHAGRRIAPLGTAYDEAHASSAASPTPKGAEATPPFEPMSLSREYPQRQYGKPADKPADQPDKPSGPAFSPPGAKFRVIEPREAHLKAEVHADKPVWRTDICAFDHRL